MGKSADEGPSTDVTKSRQSCALLVGCRVSSRHIYLSDKCGYDSSGSYPHQIIIIASLGSTKFGISAYLVWHERGYTDDIDH